MDSSPAIGDYVHRMAAKHSSSQGPEPQGSSTRQSDAFPSTAYSLLGEWLCDGNDGGLEHARRHVMTVYQQPLAIYLRGSSFAARLASLNHYGAQHHATAEDIVYGFFADRLSREVFLNDWLHSRRPLRFWLIVAFRHYLWELIERLERDRRDHMPQPDMRPARSEADIDPERRFQHDIAVTLVREAVRRTVETLASEGRADDWHMVMRHHLEGVSYRELAAELQITQTHAKVMTMRAVTRFRRTVEELAGWPGATAEQVRQEVQKLMEAIGS